MTGRWLGVAAPLLLLAVAAGACTPESLPRSEPRAGGDLSLRQQWYYPGEWSSVCHVDACSLGGFGEHVATPEAAAKVDVTISITLGNFRTSDRVKVGASYLPSDADPSARPTPIPPTFRIASPSENEPTSTTLTWTLDALQAGGRSYEFQLGPSPDIVGEGATLVIEMVPSEST